MIPKPVRNLPVDTEAGVVATVNRWRRYGKDRLYVTGDDGTKLGYRDLLIGEDHVEHPDRVGEFLSAFGAGSPTPETLPGLTAPAAGSTPTSDPSAIEAAGVPGARPADLDQSPPTVASAAEGSAGFEPAPTATGPERADWEDLAGRRAGAMAREQAQALKQAAPVRTFMARMLGVHTEERAWRIGADGEEKVAAQLEKLARKDPRWRFLHAIPVGDRGSDIDHLVVGPGGVFTLNAKHHPGANVWVGGDTLMVNGQRHPYIRNSRHEAARASKLLTAACGFPVTVRGIVVPVGAADVVVKTPPADVEVVYRMGLVSWLRGLPTVLTEQQVDAIHDAARRSTTWQSSRPWPKAEG